MTPTSGSCWRLNSQGQITNSNGQTQDCKEESLYEAFLLFLTHIFFRSFFSFKENAELFIGISLKRFFTNGSLGFCFFSNKPTELCPFLISCWALGQQQLHKTQRDFCVSIRRRMSKCWRGGVLEGLYPGKEPSGLWCASLREAVPVPSLGVGVDHSHHLSSGMLQWALQHTQHSPCWRQQQKGQLILGQLGLWSF